MHFCEECGSLMERRRSGDFVESYCPSCDDGDGASQDRSGSSTPDLKRRQAPSSTPSGPSHSRSETEDVTPLNVTGSVFPFETVRPRQDDLMADCRRAVSEGRHLVAYAPTGLGKTAAALTPAIEDGVDQGKRVFFLTSTRSQHRIAIETLKRIRDRTGLDLVVADVIGKQAMCARSEADGMHYRRFAEFCRREQAAGTCDYWETDNSDAVDHLKRDVIPVQDSVDTSAHRFGVCPHQTALDVAAQAHVVVCDYNYFFSDLSEPMAERLQVDHEDAILIVDEAHNLPDRVRDHLAVRLTPFVLDDAVEELKDLAAEAEPTEHLVKALGALGDLLDEIAPDPDGGEEEVDVDVFVDEVEDRLARDVPTISGLDYDGLIDELDDAAETFQDTFQESSRAIAMVREFLRNWRIDRQGLVRYASMETSPTLVYQLLDPRILSRPVFGKVHASILMSGTLWPTQMYRDVLGLGAARTDEQAYSDPFPDEHRTVVVDKGVTTRYEERDERMFAKIADHLADIARATPGNLAAFHPSYAVLERVRTHLASRLDSELIVERRDQDKATKEGFVDALGRTDEAVLLGVLGGSLSEGIDYADNRLKTVAVVGVPFARPTKSVQALIDHYEEIHGDKGYLYAYLYPAMNRVLQAAGRPIRSADDRAAVVLMDERFAWNRYRSALPDDMDARIESDPAKAVAEFWSGRELPR